MPIFYNMEALSPAPLNQKDICEDFLFEQIFDNGDYMCNERVKPHIAIGFIHDIPCMLEWNFNSHSITVTPMKVQNNESWTAEIIVLRLTQYNDEPDAQTICDASDFNDVCGPIKINAAYYYKPEYDYEDEYNELKQELEGKTLQQVKCKVVADNRYRRGALFGENNIVDINFKHILTTWDNGRLSPNYEIYNDEGQIIGRRG